MPRSCYDASLSLSLLLVLILSASCGPSERRNESSGYDGPAQAENEAPDGASGGAGASADTIAYVLIARLSEGDDQTRIYCECTYQDEGYTSATACMDDEYGSDYDAAVADAISCLRDVVAAQPSPPPLTLAQRFNDAYDGYQTYRRCFESIDTSACNGEGFADAQSAQYACEDDMDDAFDDFQPSEEASIWIATMQNDAENAGCYD